MAQFRDLVGSRHWKDLYNTNISLAGKLVIGVMHVLRHI